MSDLQGLDHLLANLARLDGSIAEACAPAVYREAEAIMSDSKENYVPVEDGVLRSSGYVEQPEVSGDTVTVEMGYGGAASAYALVQHENLDFQHGGGKSAKYLEKPLMEAERGMDQRLARDIQDGIERLVK